MRLGSAAAPVLAVLFVLSWSAVTFSASPDPSAESPSPSGVSPSPSPDPTSSASPTPSSCDLPILDPLGDGLRGGPINFRFWGFPSNAALTLYIDTDPQSPIGNAISNGQGEGVIKGVVPRDAPIGDVSFTAAASGDCSASTFAIVLGSPQTISVDDDTVRRGQLVTVRAGGFAPRTLAFAYINGAGVQEDCPGCHTLRFATTSAVGAVEIRVRIPHDTSLGAHHLGVHGYDMDVGGDIYLVADITVGAAGTVPRTDTD
jgi:hypothetical protein